MSNSNDARLFEALEVYKNEFKVWNITPYEPSRYNDHGVIKHRQFIVHDLGRRSDYVSVESDPEFTREIISADLATVWRELKALEKVLEKFTEQRS